MRSTDFPFAVMPQRFDKGGPSFADRARTVAKGATFAFNDEIEAGLRALAQLDPAAYQREVARIRAQQAAYEAANPYESAGLEIGGALLPALLPGGQGPAAARMASLAVKAPRAARIAPVVGEAALYGIGAADSMADIPRSVLSEGAQALGMYGVGAAAAPRLKALGVKAANAVGDRVGAAKVVKAAEKSLAVKPTQRAAAQNKPALVRALKDIRPSTYDVYSLMEANTTAGRVTGDKMMPIDKLTGGVTAAADDARRVDQLVEAMSSPEGYVSRLIVDDAGNVIEGQHRLEALRRMGVSEVPVTQYIDLERAVPFSAMRDAAAAQNIHPDQANQIAKQLAEIYADEGGKMAEVLQYSAPKGFEKAWEAAIDAMSSAATKARGGFAVKKGR